MTPTHAPNRSVPLLVLLAGALAAAPLHADVVIPSTGFSTGAGVAPADFRTDVRVYNPTGAGVLVTPVFYRQANAAAGITAATITQGNFTVPARGQIAFDNIIGGFFNQARGSFGPVRFQTSAPLVVSSATNNYNGCGNGSISGQWIPGIDVGLAFQAGELVQLATSTDAASGYRSNVVFVNPGAQPANVTAALRTGDGALLALALFQLPGNGFKQINNFKTDFAPGVATTDTNLWLEFTSDQPVLSYASVINNASGDPFAVVAIPPPSGASFASFLFTPDPKAGQAVTFGSQSTNSPLTYFWSWGDGSSEYGGLVMQHTYAAPGTYRVVLTVVNAKGGSTTAKDVVVAAP